MHISHHKTFVKPFDEKILITLFSLEEKYKKPYSFPSQDKLLKLIEQFYGLKRCRRSLNYHLEELEENGFITRRRRIKRRADGTLSLATSLYFLTAKAFSYIKGVCRFVVGILKARPTWTKQFQLKDQIKNIELEPNPARRRSKYLEVIHDTLS